MLRVIVLLFICALGCSSSRVELDPPENHHKSPVDEEAAILSRPGISMSLEELKAADPGMSDLQELYPYLKVDWSISAGAELGWSNLTVELPSEKDAAKAFATAFAFRSSEATRQLADDVESLASDWLASDRKNDISRTVAGWSLSFGGYQEKDVLRLQLSFASSKLARE